MCVYTYAKIIVARTTKHETLGPSTLWRAIGQICVCSLTSQLFEALINVAIQPSYWGCNLQQLWLFDAFQIMFNILKQALENPPEN